MLPKVASFQNLAAGHVRSAAVRPSTTAGATPSKRKSFEAREQRSRCNSYHAGLSSLGGDSPQPGLVTPGSSRPATPALPPSVGGGTTLHEVLAAPELQPWDASLAMLAALDAEAAATAAAPLVLLDSADSAAPEPAAKGDGDAASKAALSASSDAAAAAEVDVPAPTACKPSPVVLRTCIATPSVHQLPRMLLDAEPGPGQLFVYHATLNLTYVQELLSNLSHVQHMFRGVAGGASATGAAAAMAAARLLGRSLTRAANRVRSVVPVPAEVLLAPEGMHTLLEFGWAEVMTHDAQLATALGSTELSVHCMASPTAAAAVNAEDALLDAAMQEEEVVLAAGAYHRATPAEPWQQIGAATVRTPRPTGGSGASSPLALSSASSGMLPPVISRTVSGGVCTAGDGLEAAAAAAGVLALARSGGSGGGGGVPLSLEDLAAQLAAAAASVQAAAGLLQRWLDERKAAVNEVAPVSAGMTSPVPA